MKVLIGCDVDMCRVFLDIGFKFTVPGVGNSVYFFLINIYENATTNNRKMQLIYKSKI